MSAIQHWLRSFHLARLSWDLWRLRRPSSSRQREAAKRHLAERLGSLRGLPQKIGQILSLGELGQEFQPFTPLTSAGAAMPAAKAFGVIEKELGLCVAQVFRSLNPDGLAASLGQVHLGELLDGTEVAVKIQFPRIREHLEADLKALGWLAAPLSARRQGFDLNGYRQELRETILAELDYPREMAMLRRFHGRLREIPGLVSPEPVERYCTARLITMTRVAGVPFEEVLQWAEDHRREIGLGLLRFFLRGWLLWGESHADPHPGNLRFERRSDGVQIGVLDFGCVKELSVAERQALSDLLFASPQISARQLLEKYGALGFDLNLLRPLQTKLPELTNVLLEPFRTAAVFDVAQWNLSRRITQILGDDRWNFRFAGPPSLLFLIRGLQGLTHYLSALGTPLCWSAELANLRAELASARPAPASASPSSSVETQESASMPKSLRIRVEDQGELKVQLTFPTAAVSQLADLVPEELKDRLTSQGINVPAIASEATARDYPAGDLFSLQDGPKQVRVWIE